jgi:tetratricopeptide (TPR) repeat protein
LTAGLAASLLMVALVSGAVIVQQWWQAVALARKERAARQRAEGNFALARQLVSELALVGTLPLTAEFDAQRDQQRQALLKAEAYCRRMLQDPEASAEVRMTLAQVYEGLSSLYRSLGDIHEAEQAAIRAVAEWQRLANEADNPSLARGLTRARRQLALHYSNQGNLLLALDLLRQAHTHLQNHQAADFGLKMDLSDLKFDLAGCLEGTGERAEAQVLFAESHALLTQLQREGHSPAELRPRLAATCWNEGILLELLGRPRDALPYWRQARTLYQDLVAQEPHPRLTFRLAQCCSVLARNHVGSAADYTEALRLLEDASRQLDHLAAQDPALAEELGDSYYYLALLHQAAGEDNRALAACQSSACHSDLAARRRPLDPDCAGRCLRALGLLALLQDRAGHMADAATTRKQLRAGFQRLAHVTLEQRQSRVLVAWQLAKLAPDLRQTGNSAEALQAAEACRRLYGELVAETPSDASFQAGLANAWVQVAKCYWRLEDYERVLNACQHALDVQRQLFQRAPQVLEYRALLDDRYIRLERILGQMGRLNEVRDSILEREKLWPNDPARLRTLVDAMNKLADEAAVRWPQDPRNSRYRNEAARLARKADGLGR